MKLELNFKNVISLITVFVSFTFFSIIFRNWVAVKEFMGSLF
jgi:hypothetical protein